MADVQHFIITELDENGEVVVKLVDISVADLAQLVEYKKDLSAPIDALMAAQLKIIADNLKMGTESEANRLELTHHWGFRHGAQTTLEVTHWPLRRKEP